VLATRKTIAVILTGLVSRMIYRPRSQHRTLDRPGIEHFS
jgi:hypothetical protein